MLVLGVSSEEESATVSRLRCFGHTKRSLKLIRMLVDSLDDKAISLRGGGGYFIINSIFLSGIGH